MTPDQTDLDLIIIGGGPAGLTAGLYAARANMKTVLLDSKDVGGEILNTELIEDYPGFESVTGADLARKMADHALKFGLRIETYKPVKQIRSDGDRKIVELEDGTELSAYAVIVTVGRTAPFATGPSSRAPTLRSSGAGTPPSRRASSSPGSPRSSTSFTAGTSFARRRSFETVFSRSTRSSRSRPRRSRRSAATAT